MSAELQPRDRWRRRAILGGLCVWMALGQLWSHLHINLRALLDIWNRRTQRHARFLKHRVQRASVCLRKHKLEHCLWDQWAYALLRFQINDSFCALPLAWKAAIFIRSVTNRLNVCDSNSCDSRYLFLDINCQIVIPFNIRFSKWPNSVAKGKGASNVYFQ